MPLKILAPAKINICLDILKKDAKGWHEIRTIFVESPQLQDELEILETQESDKVSTLEIPPNTHPKCLAKMEDNLVYKAIKLLKSECRIKKTVEICIKKRIPFSAGLGGASSDAAVTLKGLNKFWKLNLSQKKLLSLAEKLGADVPFFIVGGTVLGEHYGEKLTSLPPLNPEKFKILPFEKWPKLSPEINPKYKTGEMYKSLNSKKYGKSTQKTEKILHSIEKEDYRELQANLHNDFSQLYRTLPDDTQLSGSGPALFVFQP